MEKKFGKKWFGPCNIDYNKKYWLYHKYTAMHIENYAKSDEDEYENISNILIVKLKSK